MARATEIKTEKDKENTENDTLKKECQEAPKTGYTINEATEILIQRVLERWRISNSTTEK